MVFLIIFFMFRKYIKEKKLNNESYIFRDKLGEVMFKSENNSNINKW